MQGFVSSQKDATLWAAEDAATLRIHDSESSMLPDFALEKQVKSFNLQSGPMRRFVIILLLLVVQLQSVWGAAASYCGHETAVDVPKHFGHHDHEHQGVSVKEAASDDSANELEVIDSDCESCHLGCSGPMPPTAFNIYKVTGDDHRSARSHRYRSHFPSGLERPDRSLHAAAA